MTTDTVEPATEQQPAPGRIAIRIVPVDRPWRWLEAGWRDLMANVNFFSKVRVDADGGLVYSLDNSQPGNHVVLRAEMNTLVVLHTCPHPLDPQSKYAPGPVRLVVSKAAPPEIDDLCRVRCEENARAFTLTERYFV